MAIDVMLQSTRLPYIFIVLFYTVTCDPPCENGACVDNDICTCSDGYIGATCTELGNSCTSV